MLPFLPVLEAQELPPFVQSDRGGRPKIHSSPALGGGSTTRKGRMDMLDVLKTLGINVISAKGPTDRRVPELVMQDTWKSIMSLW